MHDCKRLACSGASTHTSALILHTAADDIMTVYDQSESVLSQIDVKAASWSAVVSSISAVEMTTAIKVPLRTNTQRSNTSIS